MKYSYSKDIESGFEDTEHKICEALMDVGFGVLTEINMKDAFKEKLNLEYKNYKILGACNPTLAHKALESESLIGILMPCNILLIDNENQSTKIVFPFEMQAAMIEFSVAPTLIFENLIFAPLSLPFEIA